MKVTIDIDKLRESGEISQAEYERFSRLSARGTGALAFNLFVGFSVIGVGGASLALVPTHDTAIIVGLIICAASVGLVYVRHESLALLANVGIVLGALLFAGGVIAGGDGSVASFALVSATLALAGILVRSSLLTVLAVVALASCFGVAAGYSHADYMLDVRDVTRTIAVFTVLSAATFHLSKRLPVAYEGVALAATRTSVLFVNVGFWVGSVVGEHRAGTGLIVADWIFASVWAIALLVAGAWAWNQNRRWLVIVIAVFGAIDFYTQWFERLGASPTTLLIGSLLALLIAFGLRASNAMMGRDA